MNRDRTKCIPVPAGYVPLIFLIACGGWTLFIVLKFRKTLTPIEIITQLLCFYTTIQTMTYIIMFGLSLTLEYQMIAAIHVLTILFMFLCNVTFTLVFDLKLWRDDAAFKHWVKTYKKQYIGVKVAGMFFNFKSFRIVYSHLFNKMYFSAAF